MIRLPFFGMLTNRSPMNGLIEHYEQIAKGMELISDSMECFIGYGDGKECKEFRALIEEVDEVEEKADAIKRHIRNHTPRGLILPVDRVVFFTYTRQQDDILDAGQDSLYWLAMRPMNIPEKFQKRIIYYMDDVAKTIKLLKPALEATIALVTGETIDREEVKEHFRDVRTQHKLVSKEQNELVPEIFNSDMDFKEIYQLIHFIKQLYKMSHNAEGCADMLRAMIAK
ncbi:DUF47 family protein [Desulfovibrio sp. OttesenSCG-928-F07]|nr:DUF47 family protein [Desulfovibrio sp. OttesenSCG-928-F07]